MPTNKLDLSIFDRFNFEYKPVGVRFSIKKPEDVPQLNKTLALCELFREAQITPPFFAAAENIDCGQQLIGMKEFSTVMHSGSLGPMYSMFRNPEANSRIYDYMPSLSHGSVRYVSLASFDQMPYNPDIAIFTAKVSQAEILMRASTFSSGKMWCAKGTTCLACAWIFAYPYKTGEINYSVSGMGFSMKARGVLPEGLMIITVPFDQLITLIDNLKHMEWEPEWFKLGRDKFVEKVKSSSQALIKEYGLG